MKKIAILILIAFFAISAKAQDVQQILRQADRLSEAKNYTEAITLLCDNINIFGQEGRLKSMYSDLSWHYLFTKNFDLAEQAARKALELPGGGHIGYMNWVKIDLAHALLFQGKTVEAEDIYNELANTIIYNDNETYASTILDNFKQFEQANIIPLSSKNDYERIINKTNETIKIYEQFFDLFKDGKYDEAITLLQSHTSIFPKENDDWIVENTRDLFSSRDEQIRKSYYLKYLNLIKRLLENAPDKHTYKFSNALVSLASRYTDTDYENAITVLKETINILENYKDCFEHSYDGFNRRVYGNLAKYYLYNKDFNLSEQTIQKALVFSWNPFWIEYNYKGFSLSEQEVRKALDVYWTPDWTEYNLCNNDCDLLRKLLEDYWIRDSDQIACFAHALLFQGKTAEAENIYNKLIGLGV